MSEYFLKPKYLGWNVTVAIDVSSYAKKNLKNAIGVDTFHFANKTDFAYW